MENAHSGNRPREGDVQSSLGFEIQTDHLIPARRPHLVIVNKKREPAK